MERLIWACRFFGVVIALLMTCPSGWAQATTSLRGTVFDPSGAVIPGASILLVNTGTGAVRTTISDDIGGYQFPLVSPGTYRVRAEQAGFKSVAHDLQLLVNTPMTLNLKFEQVGSSIDLDVFASRLPAINTVDATIGNTFQNSHILALPLEARAVAGLLNLQPGVVYTAIEDKSSPDTRGGAVAGARSDQTNVTLDGVDVNDQQTGEAFKSVLPITLDSIQEFRVVTSNATAVQGRSSGGQISMITRSGTNLFHGSAYEYHRNTLTSANTFFNNSTIDPVSGKTIARPKLIRNVFGGSLGGPIQKNRLFFFFNFEDTITRKQEPQLRVVPSSTLRQGILQFRDTANSVRTVTPEELQVMDPLHIGQNQAALALLRQYPIGNDPTQGGDGGLNFVGFRFNAPLKEDKPSSTGRIDYRTLDNKHIIFIRGTLADWKEDDLAAPFPGQPSGRILLTNSKGTAVGDTWTIAPQLINNFHWGFTRQGLAFTGAATGPGFQFRGLDNLQNFDNRNASRKVPTHNFTDDLTWVSGRHTFQFGANYRTIHNQLSSEKGTYPYYRANDGLMRNLGRDVLPPGIAASFRTSYVRAQMALLGTISQVDITYFYNRDGGLFPVPYVPRREFINDEFEWYVQDQWKVTRNLTLTAGLRYSYFAPPYEKNGLQVRANFDVNEWFAKRRDGGAMGIPSNANPLLSFVPAGKANNAPSFFDPDKNNFAPRLALAWSPAFSSRLLHAVLGSPGQSSIRIGTSVLYDRTGGSFPITTDLNGAIGLATLIRTPSSPYNYDTAPRFSGLQNLASIPVPTAPAGGFPATLGLTNNTGFMVDTKLRTPYSTSFDLSISRELPGGLTLETAYVGRIAKKLLIQNDFAAALVNFRDPKSGQTWVQAAGIVADLIGRGAPISEVPRIPFFENIFAPMATSSLSASQAIYTFMTPYAPSWTTALHDLDALSGNGSTIYGRHTFFQQQFDWLPAWTNLGQSSYHSLQVIARKRFSNAFQADFNYTLGKAMDNGSSVESEGPGVGQLLNAFDQRQSLGFSNYDIRHQINSNFVVDMPFGRERRWAANLDSVLNDIIGGWRLTGLVRWRTGFPFSPANGFSFPTTYAVRSPAALKPGARPPDVQVTENASAGPNVFANPAAAYAAFQYALPGFSGNRNILHGPGFFTLDSGLQRVFKVSERREIQFRWEAFNVLNNVNFDGRPNAPSNRGIDIDLDGRANFGRLRSLAGNPRVMQFALRYQF